MAIKRVEINYWEGVNKNVAPFLGKKTELSRAENVRADRAGMLEKRNGTRRLGDDLSATHNFGLFYFKPTTLNNSTNKYFWRISKIGQVVSMYYLTSPSDTWTITTGAGTTLCQLGDSTTEFNISLSGTTVTYTYTGNGTTPSIGSKVYIGDELIINGQNFNTANNGTFTVTAVATLSFSVTNASGVTEPLPVTIGTGSIIIKTAIFDTCNARGNCYITNLRDANRVIASDGTIATSGYGITGAPIAEKVRYYKNKLYVANYRVNSHRYKLGIAFSSLPVGILSLVDGDQTLAALGNLNLTDTKYIGTTDTLDIYRAGVLIATITTTSKTEEKVVIGTTTAAVAVLSGDEVWVNGTFAGTRIFRWATNPITGTDVKLYDTLEANSSGPDDDEITMFDTVGNILVAGTKNNLNFWNESALTSLDNGIGCCSKKGYVKDKGILFFIHYSGIYSLSGTSAPTILSTKVEQYFTGATKANLEKAVAAKRDYNVFFWIGNVTLYKFDASVEVTLSNVVLEYDIRKELWYVHTGIEMSHFATYVATDDTDRLIFADPTDGEVFEFLRNDSDKSVTYNTSIPLNITTQELYLSQQFEKFSYPKYFILEVLRGTGIKVFVSLDDGHFFDIGEANKGFNRLEIRSLGEETSPAQYATRCRKIRISLRESSTKLCAIGRAALEFDDTPEEPEKKER